MLVHDRLGRFRREFEEYFVFEVLFYERMQLFVVLAGAFVDFLVYGGDLFQGEFSDQIGEILEFLADGFSFCVCLSLQIERSDFWSWNGLWALLRQFVLLFEECPYLGLLLVKSIRLASSMALFSTHLSRVSWMVESSRMEKLIGLFSSSKDW